MALLSLMLVAVLLFPEQGGVVGVLGGVGLLALVIKQRWFHGARYRRSLSRVVSYRRRSLVPVGGFAVRKAKFKAGKFRKSSVFRV